MKQRLIRKLFPGFGIDWKGEILRWEAVCERIRLMASDGDNERGNSQCDGYKANPKGII